MLYTVPSTTANGVAAGTQQYANVVASGVKASGISTMVLNVEAFKSTDDEYAGGILGTQIYEKSMGYTPTNYDGDASDVSLTIKPLLPTTRILQIHGHGYPG